MALPHIQNSEAGRNHYDPFHTSLFEVYFSIPQALQAEFGGDVAILSEHVQKIGGLDTLDTTPETVTQKQWGTTRTFLKPHVSETSHTLTVDLSLNLRNDTDNYVYALFRAWNKINYDLASGAITFKKNYVAPFLRVAIANRAGDIVREVIYKDIILSKVTMPGEYAYESDDPAQLSLEFKSDWAKDVTTHDVDVLKGE